LYTLVNYKFEKEDNYTDKDTTTTLKPQIIPVIITIVDQYSNLEVALVDEKLSQITFVPYSIVAKERLYQESDYSTCL
jgi:hypothetical protein